MSFFNKLLRIIAIILLIIAIVLAVYAAVQFYFAASGTTLASNFTIPLLGKPITYSAAFGIAAAAAVVSIILDPTIFGSAIGNVASAVGAVTGAAGTVLDNTIEGLTGFSMTTWVFIGVAGYLVWNGFFSSKKKKGKEEDTDNSTSVTSSLSSDERVSNYDSSTYNNNADQTSFYGDDFSDNRNRDEFDLDMVM